MIRANLCTCTSRREPRRTADATKIWITRAGKCLVAHNHSGLNAKVLRNVVRIVEARSDEVVEKWTAFFGGIEYYC